MKIRLGCKTPEEKGISLFKRGRVDLVSSDSFEFLFKIKGNNGKETMVSYIVPKQEFKCFNDQCSLWRAGESKITKCYHIWGCEEMMRSK